MIELLAIGQGLNAIKTAADLVKMITGSRPSTKISEDSVKLNDQILSIRKALLAANDEQAALVQKISSLEKQITDMETWEREKKRYDMKEVSPGAFAYILKEDAKGTDPIHRICTKCYNTGKKGILNRVGPNAASSALRMPAMDKCSECGGIFPA
jgi:hypothetical protein